MRDSFLDIEFAEDEISVEDLNAAPLYVLIQGGMALCQLILGLKTSDESTSDLLALSAYRCAEDEMEKKNSRSPSHEETVCYPVAGDLYRLWQFVHEMKDDDIVVSMQVLNAN